MDCKESGQVRVTFLPIMTASNLNPGILITTSKIGCDPAPDNVQQTISALSTVERSFKRIEGVKKIRGKGL